uniref:Uncharacterized protein n=1 Tax=Mastacembelus armatus TaxID=205130 RepID=A0A3Q3N0K5_9TELE
TWWRTETGKWPYPQEVLCGGDLTDRCYWEVEWEGRSAFPEKPDLSRKMIDGISGSLRINRVNTNLEL